MKKMTKKTESKTDLQYLSIDLLDFDPTNPRFGGLMDRKSQEHIQQELMEEPYYATELVDSFLKNGFIDYEPIVVKKNADRYLVIEGNRRLAAIREILAYPDKYQGKTDDLKHIPALVFPDKPDDQQKNEMRIYLGVRHLIGFREWPSLSKARFLDRLSQDEGGLDRVIQELRITKTQARRFLVPYRLLRIAHIEISKGDDFWTLGEALSRSGIKTFLQLEVDDSLKIVSYNKQRLAQLLNCIYGPKKSNGERNAAAKVVTDTRDLSRLARVLDSEKASSALFSGKSLEEAEIQVDTREESLNRLAKVRKDIAILVQKLTKGSNNPETHNLVQSHKQFDNAVKNFISKEHP